MPAFRIPKSRVVNEVTNLEKQGYRVTAVVADGQDVLLFSLPLWRPRSYEAPPDGYLSEPLECRPVPPHDPRPGYSWTVAPGPVDEDPQFVETRTVAL